MTFFFSLFARCRTRTHSSGTVRWTVPATSSETGERRERCRGQMKRPERVAAVGVQRRRAVAEAHTGHRNRGLPLSALCADAYRVLPTQPDRVVVTNFVATTFCFSTFRSCSLEKTDTCTAALFFPKRNCLISLRERSIILADKR